MKNIVKYSRNRDYHNYFGEFKPQLLIDSRDEQIVLSNGTHDTYDFECLIVKNSNKRERCNWKIGEFTPGMSKSPFQLFTGTLTLSNK